jgi:hypothetical protein
MQVFVTDLQAAMIKKIAYDDMTPVDGARPECADDAQTYANCVIESKKDQGVFTSLQNAGLAWHTGGDPEEAAVGLTEKGFEVFQGL